MEAFFSPSSSLRDIQLEVSSHLSAMFIVAHVVWILSDSSVYRDIRERILIKPDAIYSGHGGPMGGNDRAKSNIKFRTKGGRKFPPLETRTVGGERSV